MNPNSTKPTHGEELKAFKTSYGTVKRIPKDDFFSQFLPPLNPVLRKELDNLQTDLSTRVKRQLVATNGRLWGFKATQPSQLNSEEASRRIQTKISALVNALLPSEDKKSVFCNNANCVPRPWKSRHEHNEATVLPDAYVTKYEPGVSRASVDWTTISVSGVYSHHTREYTTKGNTDEVTRCMTRCMQTDARRRFTYGFTTEDNMMSLWFCDRRNIIVSDSFDFITDWHALLHFFLACVSADECALGFDPTISLIRTEGGIPLYEITVRSADGSEERYQCLRELAKRSDQDLLGRATRVWIAVKVVNGHQVGNLVALKDSWVDDLREREGQIYAKIRANAVTEKDHEDLNRILLTVVAHGDVYVDGKLDCTRLLPAQMDAQSMDEMDEHDSEESYFRQLIHHRIVFQEIGEPLFRVGSITAIFKALRDVCDGLHTLHRHGWVHGDISAGNILVFEGQTRIFDLEYVRRIDESREHDKTGTLMFMAVEVKSQSYIFERSSSPIPSPEAYQSDTSSSKSSRENSSRRAISLLPFRYNPLHDLESLWWIAVYFLATKPVGAPNNGTETPGTAPRARPVSYAGQRGLVKELFLPGDSRPVVIRSRANSYFWIRWRQVFERPLRDIGYQLEVARAKLAEAYRVVEADTANMDFSLVESIYGEMSACLGTITSQLERRKTGSTPHNLR